MGNLPSDVSCRSGKTRQDALENVETEGIPDLVGYIQVGSRKRIVGFDSYRFVKRYVVLRGHELKLYRKKNRSKPRCRYNIQGSALEVTKGRINKRRIEFGLSSNGVTWIWFKFEDEGERYLWEKAISKSLERRRRSPDLEGEKGRNLRAKDRTLNDCDDVEKRNKTKKTVSTTASDQVSIELSNRNCGSGGKKVDKEEEEEYDDGTCCETKKCATSESKATKAGSTQPPHYDVISETDLDSAIRMKISSAARSLHVSEPRAQVLLSQANWNAERLSILWDDSKTRMEICKSAGFIVSSASVQQNVTKFDAATKVLGDGISDVDDEKEQDDDDDDDEIECPVCWDDVKKRDTIALRCRHRICRSCWRKHVNETVRGKAEPVVVCPFDKCLEPASMSFVRDRCVEIVSANSSEDAATTKSNELADAYVGLVRNDFVIRSDDVMWCPNPRSCGRAVRCCDTTPRDISCPCGFEFCFACGEAPHEPAQCVYAREWRRIESSVDEIVTGKQSMAESDMSWLYENAKPCPRCKNPIERNHGCDHMTCRRGAGGCGHAFCWICLQGMKNHESDMCNPAAGEARTEKILGKRFRKRRNSGNVPVTARFEGFFLRYLSHQRCADRAARSREELDSAHRRSFRSHSNDKFSSMRSTCARVVERFDSATRLLVTAHRFLSWTYAQIFFLENEATLQGDVAHGVRILLEERTETLHELVESWKECLLSDRSIDMVSPSEELAASVEKRLNSICSGVWQNMTRVRLTMRWLCHEKIENVETVMRSIENRMDDKGKDGHNTKKKEDNCDNASKEDDNNDALPDGWSRIVDWSSGRAYYYNAPQKQSQWHKPFDRNVRRSLDTPDSLTASMLGIALFGSSTPWQCPRCTFINSTGGVLCNMCHLPRPPSSTESRAVEKKKWHCKACTFLNEPTSIQCVICFGTEKEEEEEKEGDSEEMGDKKEQDENESKIKASNASSVSATEGKTVSDGSWKCALCNFKNRPRKMTENSAKRCAVCDTSLEPNGIPRVVMSMLRVRHERT